MTGFTSYTDDDAMDRWRTGEEVFDDGELPVLYAHGLYSQPDQLVLATREYRRAYTGKFSRVLAQLVDTGHLVWIGFSFANQRIAAEDLAHFRWVLNQFKPRYRLRHRP